ncbi:MAG: PQQ-binding-like beta-propeller repeat protein [Candidatus Brocadiia bacterium]
MSERPRLLVLLLLLAAGRAGVSAGADWPTWRHDAARTAASPAELPPAMRLLWRRQLPPPRPAFPDDPRLCFDRSIEPVAWGGLLFVPSMVTDSVTAYDLATGERRWVFFAEGPVRLAPAAGEGRVTFVSDDGYLTCLGARDGRLRWRVRGAPPDRPDHRLLGDERLVSRWPARGGPVLAGGNVYFGAGMWPFEGTMVLCVDAETGQVRWRNLDVALIPEGLIDHAARRAAGLVPLGYLALTGGKVVVPSGRALPGFLDPVTGAMEPYTTGWGGRPALAKGSWYACGVGPYLFHSGDLFGLSAQAAAGRDELPAWASPEAFARLAGESPETVRRWIDEGRLTTRTQGGKTQVQAAKPAKTTYVSLWTRGMRKGEKHSLEAHPRLQIDPANGSELGIFRQPVLTPEAVYYSRPIRNRRGRGNLWPSDPGYAEIVAYDITRPQWGITCQGAIDGSRRLIPWPTLRFPLLWRMPSELKVHIKAGSRLYAAGEGAVAAIQLPDGGGEPRVAWRAEVAGTPSTLLAASAKLVAVSREGSLYCFGAPDEPRGDPQPEEPPAPAPGERPVELAQSILERTGLRQGYCLALGAVPLAEELARRSDLHVVVLEPEPEAADAARRRLHASGLYGSRVHVVGERLGTLRLPPYFASLAVAEDLAGLRRAAGEDALPALFASLRPYGGVLCVPTSQSQHQALAGAVREAGLPGAELERLGGLSLLRRPGALAGADDWSHESGSGANAFASGDERVRPPFGVLWFGSSVDRALPGWDYTHCRGPFPVVAGGRMFFLVAQVVHAADIYTGRHLWQAELPPTSRARSRKRNHMITQRDTAANFVAAADTLYVLCGDACLALDAATGRLRGRIPVPRPLEGDWEQVRLAGDRLLATAGPRLACLDRRSGALQWHRPASPGKLTFALAGEKVFLAAYPRDFRARARRGERQAVELAALDAASGRPLWQARAEAPPDEADAKVQARFPPLEPHLAYCEASDVLVLTATRSILGAFRGADGRRLWAEPIPCRNPPSHWSGPEPPILLPQVLVTHGGERYDPRTGEPAGKRLWLGMNRAYNSGGTRGCGRAVGNRHVVTLRDGHASYFDLGTGRQVFFRGIRSGCTNSLLPAGGILNGPNFARGCSCNWPLFLSFALVHMPEAAAWRPGRGE